MEPVGSDERTQVIQTRLRKDGGEDEAQLSFSRRMLSRDGVRPNGDHDHGETCETELVEGSARAAGVAVPTVPAHMHVQAYDGIPSLEM